METRVTVAAIEALQTIQNAANDVPLVSGKRTWVRVYLDPAGLPDGAAVSGSLSLADGEDELGRHASVNTLLVDRGADLATRRLDWSHSLNFLLQVPVRDKTERWQLRLRLESLAVGTGGHEQGFDRKNIDNGETRVEVAKNTRLRCRILRYRHRDQDNLGFVEPTRGESAAIRSYVEAAFPVAGVRWSETRLGAPRGFRALAPVERDSDAAQSELTRCYMDFFQQMLVIRERELFAGRHAKTLYLGLIDDPSGRFGGAAMDSPQFPAPHAVSMATPDPEGDLGAHEIAHALGRRHPGVPNVTRHGTYVAQRDETQDSTAGPASAESPRGFLSGQGDADAGQIHVGLDSRFGPGAPELLPHDEFFDLMTYRYPKWVSDLTYVGLMERLEATNATRFGLQQGAEGRTGVWTVIGEYDMQRQSARIFYHGESRYKTPLPPTRDRRLGALRLAWPVAADDKQTVLASEIVYFRNYDKLDGSASVGVFQHSLGLDDTGRDDFREINGKRLKNETQRKRFNDGFAAVIAGRAPLYLLLHDRIVDSIEALSDDDEAAIEQDLNDAAINPVVPPLPVDDDDDDDDDDSGDGDDGGDGDDDGKRSSIGLEYSIDDGGFYLSYRWRWQDFDAKSKLRAVTTIECRPRSKPGKAEKPWETLAVSHAREDRVWIDSRFLEDPQRGLFAKHPIYGERYPGGAAIRPRSLEVRIVVCAGFKTIVHERDLPLSAEARRALSLRRPQAGAYMPAPGGVAENKSLVDDPNEDPRRWYRVYAKR